jgi:catechol 2,3-dioxygenase-like lactoylglutathione lyase family enzyme
MIGRLHHVVIDCPEPAALAAFYSELLGLPVTYRSDDWVVIAENDTTSGIAFQRAPDHQPPQWLNPDRPQQYHVDIMVDDVDTAEPLVLGLGARRLSGEGEPWRVYADPAGHPFCLIPRPGWAPPIQAAALDGTSATPT